MAPAWPLTDNDPHHHARPYDVQVRTAAASDIPAIRAVLARAYLADPLIEWIFPDSALRVEATAAWLGLFVEHHLPAGRVQIIEEADVVLQAGVDAVAVWRMPDDPPPAGDTLPTTGGLLAALIGTDRAEAVGTGLHAIASVTPTGPYAYLQFLAVHPERQRRGLGTALLREGITQAARHGVGVHLETTNPANLVFYRAHGFDVTETFRLVPDGPELWAMYRPPTSDDPEG